MTRNAKRETGWLSTRSGRRAVPSGLRTPARSRDASRARPRAGARRRPRARGGPAGKTARVPSAARPPPAPGTREQATLFLFLLEPPSEAGSGSSREASRWPQPAVPRGRRSRRAASRSRVARRTRRNRPSRASSVCGRFRVTTEDSSARVARRAMISFVDAALFGRFFQCFRLAVDHFEARAQSPPPHPNPPCLTPSPPSRPLRYVPGAHQNPPTRAPRAPPVSAHVDSPSDRADRSSPFDSCRKYLVEAFRS